MRGGVGLFTGRPAYVWISNQYGNTGIDFNRIGATFNATANRIPFVADPLSQPTTVTGAAAGTFTNEIDMIDPDFKYPSILRGNLGYDRQLWGGFTGNFDFVFSKTVKDIAYENLNFAVNPAVTGIGGRPFFARRFPTLSDAILLKNTNKGSTWNAGRRSAPAVQQRPLRQRFVLVRRREVGHGRHLGPGRLELGQRLYAGRPEQRAAGALELRSGPPHHPDGELRDAVCQGREAGRLGVLLGHVGPSLHADLATTTRTATTVSRTTSSTSRPHPIALTYTGGTVQRSAPVHPRATPCLAEYIGQIITRNACRVPWQNTLDARVRDPAPYKRYKAEITLDALNLLNMLDAKSGLFQFEPFGQDTRIATVPTTVDRDGAADRLQHHHR